uniref:hypothetical protein n=1 Tax=Polynucleobacter sp. TaxID=2029855 RepID=UPI00404725C8
MSYVYILENKDAKRIKIGATINLPDARHTDISRMWRGIKGRCQICLNWRMLNKGLMPKHVLSGHHCAGSGELPLERSTTLAEKQLTNLQEQLSLFRGTELNYATKRIKNLLKVLQNYKENPIRLGKWELRAYFKTDFAYSIEAVAHEKLASFLDSNAPFGEVFTCSAEQVIAIIENSLKVR